MRVINCSQIDNSGIRSVSNFAKPRWPECSQDGRQITTNVSDLARLLAPAGYDWTDSTVSEWRSTFFATITKAQFLISLGCA
jgi:hypothetical protein